MTKIEEGYGDFFEFLYFLCFAHKGMAFVVYNDDDLKANCPADVCGVECLKSYFILGFCRIIA